MNRRKALFLFGIAAPALLIAPMLVGAAAEATVTLQVSGMTWGGCVSTVQSALKAVKGVKEAEVSLDKGEAVVKYDPDQAKVEDLIKAVKNAKGMSSYDAKVKK